MLNARHFGELYESYSRGNASFEGQGGVDGFTENLKALMGFVEDADGRRIDFTKRQIKPQEVSIMEMARAIMGRDLADAMFMPPFVPVKELQEDATNAVMPSAFNNISAWNTAVAGLWEVMVLEAYQRHSFIGAQLCRTVPTRLRQQKLIGHSIIGDLAENMKPGQRHPRAQFGERYVTTPETQKRGLGIDVTREAVFFDATNGGIMQMAESVGAELALRKERLIIDQFLGVTNGYTYGGTASDTYQTSTPWVNSHTNALVDFQDVDDSLQLFNGMVDAEKGEPIIVNARDVLVMPGNEMNARTVFSYDKIERSTQSGTEIGHGPNPLKSMGFNLLPTSVLVYKRITDADGLNIAASLAKEYWFLGDFQGTFSYFENWAMNTTRVAATDYTMADQDLILSMFCNEMGIPATVEPRKTVRSIAA